MTKVSIEGRELIIPYNVTSIHTDDSPWGLEVQWFSPEGEANLDYMPGEGWAGYLETTNGVMEQSQSDGTFSMAGAYYLTGDYVDPTSVVPTEPVFDSTFGLSLMGLASIDHLGLVIA